MELAFETRFLRELCERTDTAEAELGTYAADLLRRRLADLRAASCLIDLPLSTRLHADVEENYMLVLPVTEGLRLRFTANHVKNPRLPNGEIDWGRVSRIKLVCVT
jgi:hypothetical protein